MQKRYYTLKEFARIWQVKTPNAIFKHFGDDPLIAPEALEKSIESRKVWLEENPQRRPNLQIVSRREK